MKPLIYARAAFASVVVTLLIAGCANQIPPAGGPMDAEGPVITACSPPPFTVGFRGDRIEFHFDEYIDQRSFEESVFLSPSVDDVEFEWSGKTVEVIFHSPLRDSTTYVLTVGTDVTDLEPARRNRMKESFTLAFSTGPHIDRGLIDGRVFPRLPADQVSGIMVMAYYLQGVRADTLDPTRNKADYVTQTGADGSFRLPHLRLGPYALLAIRDEYRNMLYDREVDDFGVMSGPIRLSPQDTARTGIVLQLGREDTTGPRLVRIEPQDRNHVLIGFSEEVDTSTARSLIVSIIDTVDMRTKPVFVVVPDLSDLKTATIVCDYLTPDRPYIAVVTRVFDVRGNPGLPGTLARSFSGPAAEDTTGPQLKTVSLRDSTRDVDTDVSTTLTFTEPISSETMSRLRAEYRTQGSPPVSASIRWPAPTHAVVIPALALDRITWYKLEIAVRGLMDWKEIALADTTIVLTFATRDADNDGSIEGKVVDESPSDTIGSLIVSAREIKPQKPRVVTAEAGAAGLFRLDGLPSGRFMVSAFRDRNNNGVLDVGAPFPFVGSERRSLLSDTLRVRPRWPLEGLVVRLPK